MQNVVPGVGNPVEKESLNATDASSPPAAVRDDQPHTKHAARPRHVTTDLQRYDIDCELVYEVAAPTHFMFQLQPARHAGQTVLAESFETSPELSVRAYEHTDGNRFLRVDAPAGKVSFRHRAIVELEPLLVPATLPEVPVSELPDDVMHYINTTRYCESDLLCRAAMREFGHITPGLPRVQAITEWIRQNIEYLPGSSSSITTARDVYVNRAGVCRDFAHLGIAFCRALNIPARFVVGYVQFSEPPPDFHAIFEAWLGDRWVLFDPTGMAPVDRLVRVATGRDAKDVAFATLFGPAIMVSMRPDICEANVEDASAPLAESPVATGGAASVLPPQPAVSPCAATPSDHAVSVCA
ncbi:transglutaminase-like domain-containing protein [Uliginosibacterium sp. H1]|uniref:transglutaminase-like domain-containing protein n=1 Tax=Uliginosibacterium sp. H1 TaxID=3114757 RepID=UPI002E17C3A0|nr:transglutaminase family protein [Uliginosibacterium sp. H1]